MAVTACTVCRPDVKIMLSTGWTLQFFCRLFVYDQTDVAFYCNNAPIWPLCEYIICL